MGFTMVYHPKMVISSRGGKPPISMGMAPVAGMPEPNAPRKSIPSMTGILTPGMARRTMEKGEAQEFSTGIPKGITWVWINTYYPLVI